MAPAILPGDWLLVNPRQRTWPAPGRVVLFREPLGGELAVKRVAAGPGASVRFAGGVLTLGPDEAWLLADADDATASRFGFGPPIDSRRFGPVPVDQLVAGVLFRYGPIRRIGRIAANAHRGASGGEHDGA